MIIPDVFSDDLEADASSTAQGVKSIVIIGYQLLSEHTARFSRWRSFKANAILNCLEVVFWLAAIIVKFMGVSRGCSGNSCAVNCIVLLVAISIL